MKKEEELKILEAIDGIPQRPIGCMVYWQDGVVVLTDPFLTYVKENVPESMIFDGNKMTPEVWDALPDILDLSGPIRIMELITPEIAKIRH